MNPLFVVLLGVVHGNERYNVVLPIAGHAYVTVEAESSEDAIEKAMEIVTIDNVEEWKRWSSSIKAASVIVHLLGSRSGPADGDDSDED